MLKQWAVSKNQNSTNLKSDSDFIWFLSDCVVNVLSGNVPVNKNELKKFKNILRKLSDRKIGKSQRTKLFLSPSGIKLILLIAKPCAAYLEKNAH